MQLRLHDGSTYSIRIENETQKHETWKEIENSLPVFGRTQTIRMVFSGHEFPICAPNEIVIEC